MTKLSERLFLGVVALVVLCWGGYHFYRYYNDPMKFETVFEHTVPRTIAGTGIAVREELLLEAAGTGEAGEENYLHEDGARVGVGEIVAEFYRSSSRGRNMRRLRELETELEQLRQAQDVNLNNISNVDAINREIREKLRVLTGVAATGDGSDLPRAQSDLGFLINRRQIATGKAENYAERIGALQKEYDSLNATGDGAAVTAAPSPVAGYFASTCDGYESILSPGSIADMSVGDIEELIGREKPPAGSGRIGRIVTNQVWYYALPLELYQSELLRKGQAVELQFGRSATRVPAKVYDLKHENNSDSIIAIFRCDYMNAELINLRVCDVTVYSTQHTGVRISASSLQFRKNPLGETERGVYVLDGNTVRFRLVYPVYEEPGFLLSNPNPQPAAAPSPEAAPAAGAEPPGENEPAAYKPPQPVKVYDLVITKGLDLYDGKPVQ